MRTTKKDIIKMLDELQINYFTNRQIEKRKVFPETIHEINTYGKDLLREIKKRIQKNDRKKIR